MVEEIKKGYKKTKIGLIPDDWEIVNLEKLSSIIGDGIHATPVYSVNGEYSFINGNNLLNGKISVINSNKVSLQEYLKYRKELNNKTIFISINGTIGNVAFYNNEKIVLGKSAAYINLNQKLNKYYFYQIIQAFFIKQYFEDELTGTTIKNLSLLSLRNTPVPLPPTIAEQEAIATVLNDTDLLINKLEKLIEKKRAMKQGAMQELLKPKEGWEVKKLGEIGSFKNGINKSGSEFGFGFPLINLMDVFGKSKITSNEHLGLINSNEIERRLYDLRKGDVVFIRSSVKPEGVGLTCVIKEDLKNTVFSGFIIRFRDDGYLSTEFKEFCFVTNDFRNRLISSSTVSANTNINQEALKNLTLCFPREKVEQSRIAQILSYMDSEIEALEKKLDKYKMIKQGMMQNLLTGKIRLIKK